MCRPSSSQSNGLKTKNRTTSSLQSWRKSGTTPSEEHKYPRPTVMPRDRLKEQKKSKCELLKAYKAFTNNKSENKKKTSSSENTAENFSPRLEKTFHQKQDGVSEIHRALRNKILSSSCANREQFMSSNQYSHKKDIVSHDTKIDSSKHMDFSNTINLPNSKTNRTLKMSTVVGLVKPSTSTSCDNTISSDTTTLTTINHNEIQPCYRVISAEHNSNQPLNGEHYLTLNHENDSSPPCNSKLTQDTLQKPFTTSKLQAQQTQRCIANANSSSDASIDPEVSAENIRKAPEQRLSLLHIS